MNKVMTHTPHPFHIVGECESCCNASEALRTGFDEIDGNPNALAYECENEGCVNAIAAPTETDGSPIGRRMTSDEFLRWLDDHDDSILTDTPAEEESKVALGILGDEPDIPFEAFDTNTDATPQASDTDEGGEA